MADSLRLNNFELRRQFAEESDTLIRHDVAIFRSDHDDRSCNAGRCCLYCLAFGGWVEEFGGAGAWVPMPVEAPVVTAEIGRAHVRTPVTNAHLVCRLLLEKNKKTQQIHNHTIMKHNTNRT